MRISVLGTLILGASLTCGKIAYAGPAQGAVSATIQYAKIIQGFADPIGVQIYNNAPVGSDPFNYSVYINTPIGPSNTLTGSRAADGGLGYDLQNFFYNSTNAPLGPNVLTSTVTNTDSPTSVLTQSGTVQVLQRGRLAFYSAGGGVVQ